MSMLMVNLVSFDHVAIVLQIYIKKNVYKIVMYIKKIPSILGCIKKMWKGTLFKRRALGNVTTLIVQRASTEFRQLLLIISSPRK